MKKIIALALALVMMAAIAVPTFAANKTFDQAANSSTAIVEYGVGQTYTVTIPEKIVIDSASLNGTADISASNVKIAGGNTLNVRVSSTYYDDNNTVDVTTDDTWVLKDITEDSESADVNYMIQKTDVNGEKVVSAVTVVLAVESTTSGTGGNTGAATLYFSTNGTSQVGTYQDTLTFTAEVE